MELHHQYPWRRQEVLTLVVLAAIPVVAVTALAAKNAGLGPLLGLGVPVAGMCWGLAGYAAYLGWSRKRRSRIEATLQGTRFSFTGGRFREASGDLEQHDRVALRTAGREQALVFSHAGDGRSPDPETVVPLRLLRPGAAGHDDLNAALHRLVADPGRSVTPQARAALPPLSAR